MNPRRRQRDTMACIFWEESLSAAFLAIGVCPFEKTVKRAEFSPFSAVRPPRSAGWGFFCEIGQRVNDKIKKSKESARKLPYYSNEEVSLLPSIAGKSPH